MSRSPRRSRVIPAGRPGAWLLAMLLGGSLLPSGHAQREPAPTGIDAVFLDVDPAAAKKLAAVRDLLAAREWGDAVELLRQIGEQHGDRLAAVAPRRFISVQTYCDILLSSLPEEGLKLYRARIDPQAKRWFETARAHRDEAGLRRILKRAFLSSYGDDALMLLGQLAWEQGRLPQARQYWEQLLPVDSAAPGGALPEVLRSPAGSLDIAQVRARLVLCSLFEGQPARSRRELAAFRELHPQARGALAGRDGNLAELLTAIVSEAGDVAPFAGTGGQPTFAGNLLRNPVQTEGLDAGSVQWQAPLPAVAADRGIPLDEDQVRNFDRGPAALPANVLNYYPVVFENRVFYCDETAVYARELLSAEGGRPAWGDSAEIYRLPPELHQQVPGMGARAGWPRFTLSIDGRRLYTRLGGHARRRFRGLPEPSSLLVCLDLDRQGDLLWSLRADAIDADGGNWSFGGPPLVSEGRVYVVLRRTDPQLQLNVACFDAATSKPVWNRKVCLGLEMLPADDPLHHQLLTLADDRLYCCTNLGAIASLEARDGTIRWVTTYPRAEVERVTVYNQRHRQGPNPCLYHVGQIFAAPTDADRFYAINAETGAVQWDRLHKGQVPQLLGADDGKLVVAGELLWGIRTDTGKDAWVTGVGDDPSAATRGRGLIAGGLVYWPRPEEIQLVELSTGRILRSIDLDNQHGVGGGGNIAISDGWMLLAQADRLLAFSEYGSLRKKRQDEILRRPDDARGHFELARLAEMTGADDLADAEFLLAQRLAHSDERLDGRPLRLASAAALARRHNRQGFPDRAVADWQRLLDAPRDTPGDDEAALVRRHARREIDRLIHEHGRAVYAEVERAAQAEFSAAAADRDPAVVERLVSRYPQALAAEAAALRCAAAHRAAGDLYRSDALCQALLESDHHAGAHLAALAGLAVAAEQRQNLSLAVNRWQQLYDQHGAAEVIVAGIARPAADIASEHLARLRGEREVERDRFTAAPLIRAWTRELSAGMRLLVPEGAPIPEGFQGVLVAGDSLACHDAANGAPRWQVDLLDPIRWSGFVGDTLVLGSETALAGVDPARGTILWHRQLYPSTKHRDSTPAPIRGGDRLTCLAGDGALLSIVPETGAIDWRYRPAQGRLQPHWSADRDRVVIQTLSPDRWQVLDARNGSLAAEGAGPSVAWHADPQPVAGRLALDGGTGPIQFFDTDRLSIVGSDRGPQSIRRAAADLLTGAAALLAVFDGETIARIDPDTGARRWSCRAGVNRLQTVVSETCFDDERLFVASGGILRAIELGSGRQAWEQYLGAADGQWHAVRAGPWVAAYPAGGSEHPGVILCDCATGAFIQRFVDDRPSRRVNVCCDGLQMFLATEHRLVGLRPIAQVADAR